MVTVHSNSKAAVEASVITLVFLATLPLLALLALMLRGLLLVIALAAVLGGLVVYRLSRAFRDWFAAYAHPLIHYKGLRLATDVRLHPSHSWVRTDGDVWVGVDDCVQAVLGPIEQVDLPARGTHVDQGDPLFRVRHGHRTIEVRSPVSGTVLAGNPELRGHPELINREPYTQGWAVRLRGDAASSEQAVLLRGRRARDWFVAAADRITSLVPTDAAPRSESDAGAIVGELHRSIDDAAWQRVSDMFAGPGDRTAPA